VTLPAAWRTVLPEAELTVWLCPRRAFLIGSPDAAQTARDPDLRKYRLPLDRRGRVRLPRRRWLKLGRPAAIRFGGAIRRFQIWPAAAYRQRCERLEERRHMSRLRRFLG